VIKTLLVGIWLCVVTLGAAYGVLIMQKKETSEGEAHAPAKLEQRQTKMLNVPIINNGAVQGYVLAQFAFTVEAEKTKELSTKPDLIVVDEAFKLIYAGDVVDFRHMRRADIAALSKMILDNVNKRLGQTLIHEVLVQELNYLPKEQLRSSG
jgi:hypothetical protein